MTLDELIDRLVELRKAAAGASLAHVRINVCVASMNVDEPVHRVFYQSGEIIINGR